MNHELLVFLFIGKVDMVRSDVSHALSVAENDVVSASC